MLEKTHELLYAIIHTLIKPESVGELSPNMLYNLGKFTETLHKIHTFVEAEQEESRIKKFFHQGEIKKLLRGCQTGLEQALGAFKIQSVNIFNDVTEMHEHAQRTHEKVLELLSSLSDGGSSDRGSMISRSLSRFQSSSRSLSLLPSEPKIFHGRDSEVSAIIQAFKQETPRIVILGAGGMGKTSLARAVLHHPEITICYDQHRIFVACDTASNTVQLSALIGAHIGLQPAKDLTRTIIRHFTTSPPCLLILDNLETIWEPAELRGDLEKFLCLLADIEHLALMITMRGAERPANIRWTRPFLEPLKPLTQDAARATFFDITDAYSLEDTDKILLLTDNMPLAIDLMAHLVDAEGAPGVLNRWETERTSLVSDGHDKGSNLDISISLSLASCRIMSLPQAKDLLGLLSILPDGLSDIELVQSKLPIEKMYACKTVLLRTSLAYIDDQKKLKALVPIREYMQKIHPPKTDLVQCLLKYFHELLNIYDTYGGTVSKSGIVGCIASNFANIQNVLGQAL
ncbi:P-loop containing nucleoside triphosphate hydrolase protein, partial [Mycena latifolia]